jgi:glycosyltransferase involved in cell wall biosynthesis
MNKIKVLRIITRLNIGGPTIHTILLTKGLQDKYETMLIAGQIESHESDMSYFAKKNKVTPNYLKKMSRELRFPQDLIALWELYRIIKKEKPDIVHTHTAKAGTIGRIAAWLARVPIIIHTFHGNIFNGYFGKIKTNFFIWIEKMLAKLSTKIIAISRKQKEELVELGICESEKIEIIKLGFNFEDILPDKTDAGLFRKKYEIPIKADLIGIVGRLTPIKNHMLFLNICEEVLRKYQDIYFAIIGDGELKEQLEEEINKRGLKPNVFITGFIKNLKPVYADLDIVLLTSNNEGTPVALIEAMACNKIVMTTNVGGVTDFIDHCVDGFCFPKGEVKLFVDEINNWRLNNIQYEKIKNNASKKAFELFRSERLIKDIKKLYEELRGIK